MTNKQIGNLVKEIRKEKKIGREVLARGLCSDTSLSYFEKGKQKLDNLLMQRMFDRIGIEADEFSFMVTDEEYEYFLWKEDTLQAVEKQEWDKLEELLANKKIAIQKKYNEKIQHQYYDKLKAILVAEKKQNYTYATELLEKAIGQTMPDVFTKPWDKLCLGEAEIHILLLYLYYGVKAKKIKKSDQVVLYEKLVFYRKQYENFCEIFQYAQMDIGCHPEILAGRREMLFLISEYLCSERTARGWTQQKICEDICEPETYSRIETGKHAPVKTSMYKFAEKLDIPWCYYRGEIVFSSLAAYRIYQKVRKCTNRGLRENSLYWLEKLEDMLDMTIPVNIQYVEREKIVALYAMGKVNAVEAYRKCEALLLLTTELPEEKRFRYYTTAVFGANSDYYDFSMGPAQAAYTDFISKTTTTNYALIEQTALDTVMEYNAVDSLYQAKCSGIKISGPNTKNMYYYITSDNETVVGRF